MMAEADAAGDVAGAAMTLCEVEVYGECPPCDFNAMTDVAGNYRVDVRSGDKVGWCPVPAPSVYYNSSKLSPITTKIYEHFLGSYY